MPEDPKILHTQAAIPWNGDGEHTCEECGAALEDGLRCGECEHHQERELQVDG